MNFKTVSYEFLICGSLTAWFDNHSLWSCSDKCRPNL